MIVTVFIISSLKLIDYLFPFDCVYARKLIYLLRAQPTYLYLHTRI